MDSVAGPLFGFDVMLVTISAPPRVIFIRGPVLPVTWVVSVTVGSFCFVAWACARARLQESTGFMSDTQAKSAFAVPDPTVPSTLTMFWALNDQFRALKEQPIPETSTVVVDPACTDVVDPPELTVDDAVVVLRDFHKTSYLWRAVMPQSYSGPRI